MEFVMKNILVLLCYGTLAAANIASEPASPLCILGCCGLVLPMDSTTLSLQSPFNATSAAVHVSVPLSSPELHCCPCPNLNGTSTSSTSDKNADNGSSLNSRSGHAQSLFVAKAQVPDSEPTACGSLCSNLSKGTCDLPGGTCKKDCCPRFVNQAKAALHSISFMDLLQIAQLQNSSASLTGMTPDVVPGSNEHDIANTILQQLPDSKKEL